MITAVTGGGDHWHFASDVFAMQHTLTPAAIPSPPCDPLVRAPARRRGPASRSISPAPTWYTANGCAVSSGARKRASTCGPREALTAQEAQVPRLAAEGHTNPEIGAQLFISPRTTEYRLALAYRTAHRLSASPGTLSSAGDPR